MTEYGGYTETNTVISVVFYDWRAKFDLVEASGILDQVSELVGRLPDIGSVVDGTKGKDYLYQNFVRRDVIRQRSWSLVSYLWKRSANVLSDFAIEIGCELDEFRRFSIYLDEKSVGNPRFIAKKIVEMVVGRINPIYGIGYTMPYFWGPRSFAQGSVSSRFATVDSAFYGPPEKMRQRSFEFGPIFRSNQETHYLNNHLRDLFELNFLSEGHLSQILNGKTLRDWIVDNRYGKLHQLTPVTWAWEVPSEDIERLRRPLIDAGLTVVKQ